MDEFSLINKYIKPLVTKNKEALSLLDDVAIINIINNSHSFIVTTDCVIEDVHFFKDEDPKSIAYRLMISNLSDLATKGGDPKYFTLTFCPKKIGELNPSWVKTFFETIKKIQKQYKVKLIGGNISSTNTSLMISVTLIGSTTYNNCHLPFRFKAKKNDNLYISNYIGNAYLGYCVIASKKRLIQPPVWLSILKDKELNYLANSYYYPKISVSLGKDLLEIANSVTDASDGLGVTLYNICTSSNIKSTVRLYPYMFSGVAQKIFKYFPKEIKNFFSTLINWGGDYNLVFSVPKSKIKLLDSVITKYKKHKIPIFNIGYLHNEAKKTMLEVKDIYNNEVVNMNIKNYIHK